jgi:hypothetical protein
VPTLGAYPDVSLKRARERRDEARSHVSFEWYSSNHSRAMASNVSACAARSAWRLEIQVAQMRRWRTLNALWIESVGRLKGGPVQSESELLVA